VSGSNIVAPNQLVNAVRCGGFDQLTTAAAPALLVINPSALLGFDRAANQEGDENHAHQEIRRQR
jgi:hypothetical protein